MRSASFWTRLGAPRLFLVAARFGTGAPVGIGAAFSEFTPVTFPFRAGSTERRLAFCGRGVASALGVDGLMVAAGFVTTLLRVFSCGPADGTSAAGTISGGSLAAISSPNSAARSSPTSVFAGSRPVCMSGSAVPRSDKVKGVRRPHANETVTRDLDRAGRRHREDRGDVLAHRTRRSGQLQLTDLRWAWEQTGILSADPLHDAFGEPAPCSSSTRESMPPEQSAQSAFHRAFATSPMLTLTW